MWRQQTTWKSMFFVLMMASNIHGTLTQSPEDLDCTFDNNNICSWFQDTSDVTNWIVSSGQTATSGTGPSGDHTTGYGYYIYMEASSNSYNDNARLFIANFVTQYNYCMTFYYHMHGRAINELQVYTHDEIASYLHWRLRGNQENRWIQAKIQMTTSSNGKQLIIEAKRGTGDEGDIAVDDIMFIAGWCNTPEDLDCTFDDNNTCRWLQDVNDVTDWILSSGQTATSLTGPSSDHTTGNGYYVYMEASSISYNDNARLFIRNFPTQYSCCMTFYYHMHGRDMNELRVYTHNGTTLNPLWRRQGNQGDRWLQAKIQITSSGGKQIVIEAKRGTSDESDIAVDDIMFIARSCNLTTTTQAPTTTVKTTTQAPTTDPEPRLACDFDEKNICLWQQDENDDGDWRVDVNDLPSSEEGPSGDHTTGSGIGYYTYFASSPGSFNETAGLTSPEFINQEVYCMTFYYWIYGEDHQEVNVYSLNPIETLEWNGQLKITDDWVQFWVKLRYIGRQQVTIETVGGGIAIDDIVFIPGCEGNGGEASGYVTVVIVATCLMAAVLRL